MESLVDVLRGGTTVIAAELRPPRAELESTEGMDAWIDLYHTVRALAREHAVKPAPRPVLVPVLR